jgi:hypothetical protein
MKTFLICNPAAGGIADRKALLKKLKATFGSSIWFTKRRGDATRLARQAVRHNFCRPHLRRFRRLARLVSLKTLNPKIRRRNRSDPSYSGRPSSRSK